jgi:shikimate dehydrogenase
MNARRRTSFLAGLLGQGVKPSLTPELHEREAARQGLRYVYKTIDLADHELDEPSLRNLLDHAVRLGFDGLNVTHPLKQAMRPLVDRVAPDVRAIGALNTVLVCDGETVGHNTDAAGFERAFREGLRDAALDVVVLLGAGGAGTSSPWATDPPSLPRTTTRCLNCSSPPTAWSMPRRSAWQRTPAHHLPSRC